MGDNRPPVYWEGDNLVIRASALGTSCLWELAAAGQGYEPGTLPPALVRAFQAGTDAEPYVIKRLKQEYGLVFLSSQEEGDWEIAPNIIVRHHPDGIANLGYDFWANTRDMHNLRYDDQHTDMPPRTVVVEVKWLGDALWQKFVKHGMSFVIGEYPWQGSVMMVHHAMPLLWVAGNKEAPDHPLWFELRTNPPIDPLTLQDKAITIKELVTGEDILESERPCDDTSHWPCRYQHLRPEPIDTPGGVQDSNALVVHADDMDKVNRAVRQYIYFKGQADESASGANRERDSILEMGAGYDRIETDTWSIPIHGGDETSQSLDTDAMRADGIDVDKYYKTKPKSRYINKRNIKRKVQDE